MQTEMRNKKKSLFFISQQYQIGLYVAVYKTLNTPPIEQLNLNTIETKFHKDLRDGKVLTKLWRYHNA